MIKNILKSYPGLLPILAIAALAILIYSNTFQVPFVFDDGTFIVENYALRNLSNFTGIWNLTFHPSRFVAFYTFALNYHFNKLDLFGYHLVNLLIHIISGICVFWFSKLILKSPKIRNCPALVENGVLISLCAALIFVSHPIQTQAATYISQRFASLATMFYLLTICLYFEARRERRGSSKYFFAGAFISTVLCMFTKEIAITLPLSVLFVEMFWINSEENKLPKQIYPILAGIFLIVPIIFHKNIFNVFAGNLASASHKGDVFSVGTYILTQFHAFITFLRLFFYPAGQNLDYDFHAAQSLFANETLLCAIYLLAILSAAFYLRKRNKMLSFGIFWFFLALLPNFIPRQHVIFEHKMYLPSVGLCIALSACIFQVLKNKKKFIIFLICIVCLLSFLTYKRNKIWQTSLGLWSDVIEKSPMKARGYANRGFAHKELGKWELALNDLNRAIKIDPEYRDAYNNRGLVLYSIRQYDLARKDFLKAIELDENFVKPYNNIGLIHVQLGGYDRAMEMFEKTVALSPNYIKGHYNRGAILIIRKEFSEALSIYDRILEIDPLDPESYNNRGVIHLSLRNYQKASEDFDRSIRLKKRNPEAHNNRGLVYLETKEYDRALSDFNIALSQKNLNVDARSNRGFTHHMMGNLNNAFQDISAVIQVDPKNSKAYYRRSLIYSKNGETEKAIKDALKAQALGYNVDTEYIEGLKKK